MAAAGKVFGTTELLEQILLDLPYRQLFSLMRISRNWQATIAGSPKIRTALFLAPDTWRAERTRFTFPFDVQDRCTQPTIAKLYEQILVGSTYATHVLKPAAFVIFGREKGFLYPRRNEISGASGEGSSWRSMFLTQPPVKAVSLFHCPGGELRLRLDRMECDWRRRGFDIRMVKHMSCRNEAGVTLEDAAKTAKEMRPAAMALLRHDGLGESALEFVIDGFVNEGSE